MPRIGVSAIPDNLNNGGRNEKDIYSDSKSKLEYVAICLELNVSARGEDLAAVEKNLRAAIELYIEDTEKYPKTIVSHISTEEFIKFLKDTEPEWYREPPEGLLLRPLEVHEVPSYA